MTRLFVVTDPGDPKQIWHLSKGNGLLVQADWVLKYPEYAKAVNAFRGDIILDWMHPGADNKIVTSEVSFDDYHAAWWRLGSRPITIVLPDVFKSGLETSLRSAAFFWDLKRTGHAAHEYKIMIVPQGHDLPGWLHSLETLCSLFSIADTVAIPKAAQAFCSREQLSRCVPNWFDVHFLGVHGDQTELKDLEPFVKSWDMSLPVAATQNLQRLSAAIEGGQRYHLQVGFEQPTDYDLLEENIEYCTRLLCPDENITP